MILPSIPLFVCPTPSRPTHTTTIIDQRTFMLQNQRKLSQIVITAGKVLDSLKGKDTRILQKLFSAGFTRAPKWLGVSLAMSVESDPSPTYSPALSFIGPPDRRPLARSPLPQPKPSRQHSPKCSQPPQQPARHNHKNHKDHNKHNSHHQHKPKHHQHSIPCPAQRRKTFVCTTPFGH